MTLSHEAGRNDTLVRYLLGLLPDEETQRLEEMSVTDDEIALQLRVAEDDLVDAYVSGTLTGETLERFESFYLSSAHRHQKMRFARSLQAAIDRGAEPRISTGSSLSHRLMALTAKAPWIFAAAATLILACGAMYEEVRLRGALNEARRVSAVWSNRAHDLEQQIHDRPIVSAGTKALGSGSTENTGEPDVRPAGAVKTAPPALPAIALVLLPQTRAAGPIATLAVPRQVERVALEMRLEPNDFPRYQASLRDPVTSEILWRSDKLTARTAADVPTVAVSVPAGVLKAQHYSLELSGLSAGGGAESVGSYVFEVVRR